ncbi:Sister chromatid cohesion protein 2 [Mortierella alpina]|nr:Sister chromatid cohesion protein 2 [Mortierella alpina]
MAEHGFISQVHTPLNPQPARSTMPCAPSPAHERLIQQQQQQQQPRQQQPHLDSHGSSAPQLPHSAQAGLQYTALASITSTDSVLRDLPSLSVAFPEFRLTDLRDPAVQIMLGQQGLSAHAVNFQTEYLKAIVANANVDNIRFQPASQITASKDDFTPQCDQPLSVLAESVLAHCSQPQTGSFYSGDVYQLPRIDPYNTLIQFKQSHQAMDGSLSAPLAPATSVLVEPPLRETDSPDTRLSGSQKRSATDSTDDEQDAPRREYKKIKSRLNSDLQPADPVSDFEDTVAELMDRVDIADAPSNANGDALYLSQTELKHLTRAVEVLSRQKLLADVQIDSISSLLRYLDSVMSHFDATDVLATGSGSLTGTDQERADIVTQILNQASLSLEHISLSLVILNGKGLQQHVFPEELLFMSLNVFKSHLETLLAPALEFSKDDNGLSNGSAIFKTISQNSSLRTMMLSLISATGEISEKLRRTGDSELSENIIVKLVYIGLALFFIDTSSELMVGLTEAESLKQSGSSLLRMIYAKHPNQRTWILEEILSLLIKLPHGKKVAKGYRLVDGSRIHASSALLMQLVHTCAESPMLSAPPLDYLEMPRSTQMIETRKLLDGVRATIDSAKANIGYILNFLLTRCTKGSKSSLEAEYRTVLDSLVADLLTAVGQPEWPSAELCLFVYSKAMAKYLDDPKVDSATKSMAVDSLGLIAAKIKTISNKLASDSAEHCKTHFDDKSLPFYGQLSMDIGLSDLLYLQANQKSVEEYLGSNEVNDPAVKAAKNSWICQWLSTICSVTTKDFGDRIWDNKIWDILAQETFRCWKGYNSNKERSPKSRSTTIRKAASQSATYLTSRQQLFSSFDMLLSRILRSLEGGAVALRAKSLKALSLIVTGDSAVLAQHDVRRTIALRLQDQSPSVRDAAIDLVGKYMLQDATIRKAYYEIVSDRISDTGLNVRKRVLRLLKDMFYEVDDAVRNDISSKLLLRVNDDETTVRDLAIKSVSEVWFGPFLQATRSLQDMNGESLDTSSPSGAVTPSQRRDVFKRAKTMVDMVGQLSIAQDEAFGSVIQYLLRKERGHTPFSLSTPSQEFARTCAVIVDALVDLIQTFQEEDAPKAAVISTVHTLHTFIRAEPRLIEAKHLTGMLAYLHCSSTSEDWRITMFVLKIFQVAIPVVQDMPSNDSLVAEKLVLALVAKCPVVLLPEVVSVLCLLVRVLKLPSMRLCKFFKTCVDLLSADANRLKAEQAIQENKTRRLMTIVGLFCQYFLFEEAIEESPGEAHLDELKVNMRPTVQEFVFAILHSFFVEGYSRSLQQTALQSLGYIFLTYPGLMNSAQSISVMDSVFAGQDDGLKTELLHIYTNFLLKIQITPASEEGRKAGYSLIAKAEDQLEAGIGSSIMQRYLERVLQCALADDRQLQCAAVDVVSQVTLQALAHPMLCMPAIVALETSTDRLLSERSYKIHQDLHQKHASLIYARSMDCIKTMYAFQKRVQREKADVQGYKVIPETGNSVALLSPLYSLVSDKRQARNSLLSGLVKVLDVDLAASEIELDGNFVRFVAENLSSLDYRTMEEIYLVIFYLNRIIAGSGMTLLVNMTDVSLGQTTPASRAAAKSTDTTQKRGSKNSRSGPNSLTKSKPRKETPQTMIIAGDESGEDVMDGFQSGEDDPPPSPKAVWGDDQEPVLSRAVMCKASVAVEAAIHLKSHLKRIYDISETKCQQFQPSAHASHKEKPVPRFLGALARIHWHWRTHETEVNCGQRTGLSQEGEEALMARQLARFKILIEAETVRVKDEDISGTRHSQHDAAARSQRGHRKKSNAPSPKAVGNGWEDQNIEEEEEDMEDDDDAGDGNEGEDDDDQFEEEH